MSRHKLPAFVLVTALVITSVCITGDANEVDENKPIQVSGRVVDPDGGPLEGDVKVIGLSGEAVVATRSDAQGRFELAFRPAEIKRPLGRDWKESSLVASAEGFGPAWIRLGETLRDRNPTLKLVRDDIPIRAQIVDMDGRPVEGAKLRVYAIYRTDSGNLDAYLKQLRDEPTQMSRYRRPHMLYLSPKAIPLSAAKAYRTNEPLIFQTDKDGRLEIRGIGPERTVGFSLSAPGIISELFTVLTRPQIGAKWKRTKLSRVAKIELSYGTELPTVYAAKFTHVASVSRPIAGTVRDNKTGEPLAGVTISAQMKGQSGGGHAKTDKDGRYVVHGVPTQGTVSLYAVCPKGMPYLNAQRREIEFSAAAPVKDTDFKLVKGIIVRGKLIDSSTGKPAKGRVEYFALRTNEFANRMPDPLGPYGDCITDKKDGRYEVVALPGPGLLVAKTYESRFLPATLEGLDVPTNSRGNISTINRGLIRAERYDVLIPVSISADTEALTVDLKLKTGDEIQGRLVDSKGQPVHGAAAKGLSPSGYRERLVTSEFTVAGMRSGEKRTVVFRHDKKRLGSIVKLQGKSGKELKITMRAYATLTGRIVDADSRPVAQAQFALMSQGALAAIKEHESGRRPRQKPLELAEGMTNADGRFHITNIISGFKCELFGVPPNSFGKGVIPQLLKTVSLRSGETRDIGDLQLKAQGNKPQ